MENLEGFVSEKGARFYNLPLNSSRLTLKRESWIVPDIIGGAVPLLAGQKLNWKIYSE